VDKVTLIDYKDISRLRRHLSERGKIEPRRKTGTCARHQRALAVALKRARHVALLPYTAEHIRLSGMVLRSPDDRRGGDRGPRRDMPAPPVSADAAAATNGAAADGAQAPADGVQAPSGGAAPVTAEAGTDEGAPAATPAAEAPASAPAAAESPAAVAEAPAAAPSATAVAVEEPAAAAETTKTE
jgi:small subunit ribosomal protein S18